MSAALQNEMDRLREENNHLKSRNDALALKLETIIHTAQVFIDSTNEEDADDALDTHEVAVAMQPLDYEKKLEGMRTQLNAALEREQALAAQVEYLDGLRRNVIEAIGDDRFEDLDASFYRDDTQPPSPTTCLARRDLIKQAEALEHRADCIMAEAGYLENFRREVAGLLRNDAKDKRQQAEDLK